MAGAAGSAAVGAVFDVLAFGGPPKLFDVLTSFEGPLFLTIKIIPRMMTASTTSPAAAFPILVRRLASRPTIENIAGEIESPPVTTVAPH